MHANWKVSIGLAIATLVVGCEQRPYGLAPVSGVITLDGNPVPGAQVSFQPQGGTGNENPGPGSTALCDSAGRYELTTVKKEPGAVPGPHAVRIYGPYEGSNSGSDLATGKKELFPTRYNYQTELTFEVPPEGTSSADFECTSN